MNVSDQIIGSSNGLLKIEPEVSDNTKKYHMFNSGSVEVEVAEFLYALVKLMKPQRVLETGSHFGVSALYMAQALREMEAGCITSIEWDRFYWEKANELWRTCGVSKFVESVHGSSLDYEQKGEYEIIFLDTEPGIRFQEFEKYFPSLTPGGIIMIHDLHRHMSQQDNPEFFGWPFGALPEKMKQWGKERAFVPVHFPSPRGFSFFYKPAVGDYHWL